MRVTPAPASSKAFRPGRAGVPPRALPTLVDAFDRVGDTLQAELMLGSAMHVPITTAGSCLERYSQLMGVPKTAPAVTTTTIAMPTPASPASTPLELDSTLRDEATCLATPYEPSEEGRTSMSRLLATRADGTRLPECLMQEVRQAQQALLNLEYSTELGLEASDEQRRRRRRALMRVLAAGRSGARSLMTLPRTALALLSADGA